MGCAKFGKPNHIPPILCMGATHPSKKNQLIKVSLPSFINQIILRSKGVDSFDPHLPTFTLTDFSFCQLARFNKMGGGPSF